jgi:succinate dehydrogenase (ubiquinone) iron-sulfur subunit
MKSSILKDLKKRRMSTKYEIDRLTLKFIIRSNDTPSDIKLAAVRKLNELPKNSSPTRIKNRCIFTGRSKGIVKKYRLSRIIFRQMALSGDLSGIQKSSW